MIAALVAVALLLILRAAGLAVRSVLIGLFAFGATFLLLVLAVSFGLRGIAY